MGGGRLSGGSPSVCVYVCVVVLCGDVDMENEDGNGNMADGQRG